MEEASFDKTVSLVGNAGIAGEAFDAGGRFVLERALGSGGMGTAWLARDTVLLRSCVIKVLHTAMQRDGAALQRFLHEARLTARLRHPHVVTTYDLGVSPSGVPFLVLEHLVGRPLDQILATEGPMRPARCVAIAIQVLRALDAAHAAGIVHHDVKPANVFVEGSGVVKLVDFGVAAFVGPIDAGLGRPTAVGGTPAYMAPEQFDAGASDPRSDVWAVGVLLYELRTGQIPFEATSFAELLGKIFSAEVTWPVSPGPGEPGDLELGRIATRALAKRADDRFATAGAMADALEALWTSIAPPAGGLERVAVGDVPSAIIDRDVEFTVYRPKALPTRSYAKIVAFAHRQIDDDERAQLSYDDPVKEVERRADEVLGAAHDHARERGVGIVGIPRGHQITFVPRAAGVVFDPPSRTFAWTEPVHREVFLARAESAELGARIEAVLEVFLGALILAEVRFTLEVGEDAGGGESKVTARPFSRVFVSYADGDAAVAEQVKALTAMLTGARYSESSREERQSQVLGESGRAAIETAEAVQLLWSEAALASPLVDDELRHAIARRGPNIVRPVCWQLPPPVDEARDRPPRPVRALPFTPLLAPANALLAAVAGGIALPAAPSMAMPSAPAPAPAPAAPPPVTLPGFGAPPPTSDGEGDAPKGRSGVRLLAGALLGAAASVAALVLFLFFRAPPPSAGPTNGIRPTPVVTAPTSDRTDDASPTIDTSQSAWPALDEDAGREREPPRVSSPPRPNPPNAATAPRRRTPP